MNPYFSTPPAVKNIIIINTLLFLATALIQPFGLMMAQYGELYWVGSPYFHTYQFATYMFLHASVGHLFFNMFALWMFGRTLEYELGTPRFLAYYLICGIGAAIIQIAVVWLTGETGFRIIGASGAVMGLLLAFGVMHPNEIIFIFPFPMPIKAKWFVIGYAALELFYGCSGIDAGVAHFAHIGGMLWGLALLYYWKRKGDIYF